MEKIDKGNTPMIIVAVVVVLLIVAVVLGLVLGSGDDDVSPPPDPAAPVSDQAAVGDDTIEALVGLGYTCDTEASDWRQLPVACNREGDDQTPASTLVVATKAFACSNNIVGAGSQMPQAAQALELSMTGADGSDPESSVVVYQGGIGPDDSNPEEASLIALRDALVDYDHELVESSAVACS